MTNQLDWLNSLDAWATWVTCITPFTWRSGHWWLLFKNWTPLKRLKRTFTRFVWGISETFRVFKGDRNRMECTHLFYISFLGIFFRFNSRWPYSERIFDPFPVPQREGPVISAKTYQTRKCRNILKTGSIYKTDQEIIDILLSRNPHQKGLYFYTTTCRWITNHQRTQQSFVMMDLLNIFLQLINAYAGVVECSHLVGWKGWGKTYEKIGKNRYNAFIGSCMICNCWIYCICILFISHQEPHPKVIQLIF